MTRISLKESYDDRTVIVKLARIEDTAIECKGASEKAVTSAQDAEASAKASLDACNAAKASAEQSAKDAKASADVVATYDARLNDKVGKTGDATPQIITGTGGIQVQGDVSVGGDLTVAESGSVHMDGSDMEIAGMAIEKSGTTTVLSNELGGLKIMGELSVPTTPTGSKSMLVVNGSRLQNDLDSYAPMVRTTGNQTVSGEKSNTGHWRGKSVNINATTPPTTGVKHGGSGFVFSDANDVTLASFYVQQLSTGAIACYLVLRNTDGSSKFVQLGISDVKEASA